MDDELDLNNPPFPLTAIDRQILATPDEEYHRVTWAELREIIASNRLESLKRLPSDLHKYLRWSHATKTSYGSINNFVVQERLHWTPLNPSAPITADSFSHHSPTPFADPRDYKVLRNDWPYGFEPGIAHLLVWSRTPIAVDAERGDLTSGSRECVEAFVGRFFVARLGVGEEARGRVLWFKNWVGLQSVRGVDHVHVLVRGVPEGVIGEWVGE